MRALSLAIVGTQYPNQRGPSRRFELELLRPGDPIELRPEPKNPADENAIAIFSEHGVQLGYVTAERAPLVLSYIRTAHPIRAVFQGFSHTGPWVRVTFDGSEPVVDAASDRGPQALRRANEPEPVAIDDGFYPDEIYPDE